VPSATFLDDVAAAPAAAATAESEGQPQPATTDGSLSIGSLKKDAEQET
jgi:porphyrinogen peroxidase